MLEISYALPVKSKLSLKPSIINVDGSCAIGPFDISWFVAASKAILLPSVNNPVVKLKLKRVRLLYALSLISKKLKSINCWGFSGGPPVTKPVNWAPPP